ASLEWNDLDPLMADDNRIALSDFVHRNGLSPHRAPVHPYRAIHLGRFDFNPAPNHPDLSRQIGRSVKCLGKNAVCRRRIESGGFLASFNRQSAVLSDLG